MLFDYIAVYKTCNKFKASFCVGVLQGSVMTSQAVHDIIKKSFIPVNDHHIKSLSNAIWVNHGVYACWDFH